MSWLILILGLIILILLASCKPKPIPTPEPDPEPDKPKWSAFYPVGHIIPSLDFGFRKWQKRNFISDRWSDYENKIINFMIAEDRKDKYDELTLAKLLTHKENGRYFFKWTSDLEVFNTDDYWAPPDEYVVDKHGLGDCDDFAGFHCDYLFRECKYYLVWWVEVYWVRKYFNNVSNQYEWKNLGHAITLLKRSPESNWKCFSNNSFLGMSNGFETFEEIIYKFVPINLPSEADNYKLTKVVAREPVTGTLLFEWK
jgi:hypothetical protein